MGQRFLLIQLGALFVEQITKPVSQSIKAAAKNSEAFKNGVCIPMGQMYHRLEMKVRMWEHNTEKSMKIPELNDEQAINVGANLMGEIFIFAVMSSMVFEEIHRSRKKERKLEAKKKQEIIDLQNLLARAKDNSDKNSIKLLQIKEVIKSIHSQKNNGAKSKDDKNNEKDICFGGT